MSKAKAKKEPKLPPLTPRGHYPAVGDRFYIDTKRFISHGCDNIDGGWAKVLTAKRKPGGVEITLEGFPGWRFHPGTAGGGDQAKLRKEFGNVKAKPNPDNSIGGNIEWFPEDD